MEELGLSIATALVNSRENHGRNLAFEVAAKLCMCLVQQARNDGFGTWELERELEADANIQKMAGT